MNNKLIKMRHINYAVFSKLFEKPINNTVLEQVKLLFHGLLEFAKNIEDNVLENNLYFALEFMEKNSLLELNREYTSLFISGAYGKIICPVESIYLGSAGLIMGEERDKVLKIYINDNFTLSNLFHEQEDHISAELSYISMKNYNILNDIGYNHDNIDKQYFFVKNHIIPLLSNLIDDLLIYDANKFYYNIACIVFKYIEYDFIKSYS